YNSAMSVKKMTMSSCPPKRPRLHLSAHADVILRGRYLAKNVAGTIVETPAQLLWRVATDSARAERLYPTRRRQQSLKKPSICRSRRRKPRWPQPFSSPINSAVKVSPSIEPAARINKSFLVAPRILIEFRLSHGIILQQN